MKQLKRTALAASVVAALTACGGGGGGGTGASQSTQTPPVATTPSVPAVTPADIQTTVPALTYANQSTESTFVSGLNQFRQQLGLGLLAQNAALDKSAQNHLYYVLTNDVLLGGTVDMNGVDPSSGLSMAHIEQVGKPGFTGVRSLDRANAAGYGGSYTAEELVYPGGQGGAVALDSLIRTVYHRAGLMFEGPRDVGIAVGQNRSQTVVLEIGFVKAQTNASDFLAVYPSDNQVGVKLNAMVEAPNPFPDLSTTNADFPTKTGYPVSLIVKEGTSLTVSAFTLTEAGSAVSLDARLLTKDNDPNRLLGSNVAFLVAKAPLKPNTTYSADFSGKVGSVNVAKKWKFTTGS